MANTISIDRSLSITGVQFGWSKEEVLVINNRRLKYDETPVPEECPVCGEKMARGDHFKYCNKIECQEVLWEVLASRQAI